MTEEPIVDLYAGPGGWSEGLRLLGHRDIGIEWDRDACLTRRNAGHATIRADLTTYPPPLHLAGRCAAIASPPCPTFSAAGTGEGREQLPRLVAQAHAGDWDTDGLDDRTAHVLTVGRWLDALRPTWVALEQVPAVLPIWRALAHVLDQWGYSVWTGELCAADYGVPQTRRRAIVMASRERAVTAPVPTHAETPGMFGELPWVSMADALGWGETIVKTRNASGRPQDEFPARGRPSRTMTGKSDSWVLDRRAQVGGVPVREVPMVEPAPTMTAAGMYKGAFIWRGDDDIERLTLPEALTLQSFRPDYPLAGTKTSQFQQVGNANPPLFARAILAGLVDHAQEVAA